MCLCARNESRCRIESDKNALNDWAGFIRATGNTSWRTAPSENIVISDLNVGIDGDLRAHQYRMWRCWFVLVACYVCDACVKNTKNVYQFARSVGIIAITNKKNTHTPQTLVIISSSI